MAKEFKEESKKRLKDVIAKKMKTIMIGSLAIIEEEIVKDSSDIRLKSVYDIVRQRILDLGNNQIRNAELEIEDYTIESNRYTYSMRWKTE